MTDERLGSLAKLRLATEVARTYLQVRRTMRGSDLPRALARLRRPLASRPLQGTPVTQDQGIRLGNSVARTLGALPADSRCLMQSLVLTAMLARRGAETRLVIGVRPGEDFLAHAWVELEGSALLPPMEDEFARLTDL